MLILWASSSPYAGLGRGRSGGQYPDACRNMDTSSVLPHTHTYPLCLPAIGPVSLLTWLPRLKVSGCCFCSSPAGWLFTAAVSCPVSPIIPCFSVVSHRATHPGESGIPACVVCPRTLGVPGLVSICLFSLSCLRVKSRMCLMENPGILGFEFQCYHLKCNSFYLKASFIGENFKTQLPPLNLAVGSVLVATTPRVWSIL